MSEVFAQLMPDRFSEIGKDIGHRSIARCQINRQTIGNIVKRYRLGLYKMVLQWWSAMSDVGLAPRTRTNQKINKNYIIYPNIIILSVRVAC